MIDYKINLSDKYLANILYEIGYHFYKGINGMYLQFEVRKNVQNTDLFGNVRKYTIIGINENDNECEFFSLDENNKICDIHSFLLKYFEFDTNLEIIVDDWESYIIGGIKE